MSSAAPNFIWRKSVSRAQLVDDEARLNELSAGAYAVIEQAHRKRVLLECFCERAAAATKLIAALGGTAEKLPRGWETQLFAARPTKPLRIGKRLLVLGGPNALPSDQRETPTLIIPAGVAFGTGEHATTAMSLRLLERVTRNLRRDWRMFDAGTGSGILALAGNRFGARTVLATDNDPMAISTAKANARNNGIAGVRFRVADITNQHLDHFDIITANLYSELLAKVLPKFRRSLDPDGFLICSGVLRSQEPELTRKLRTAGFRLQEMRRRGKWVALLAKPTDPRPKTQLKSQGR